MNNDLLAEKISNKNEFVSLCSDLQIPTVPTHPCNAIDDFLRVQKFLKSDQIYIVKPVQDRMRLDDQRRRFSVCETMDHLENVVSDLFQDPKESEGFQIQEYVDFRREAVKYYNLTFNIGANVREYITTEQIINVSAIHNNIQSLHWGNMSPSAHPLLAQAEGDARRLAQHYFEMGYRGEIGIDFGLRENGIFFLETNARVNNGTRLYYDLMQLGVDPSEAKYIFVRNKLLETSKQLIQDLESTGEATSFDRPDDRKLIVARSAHSIESIYRNISALAKASTPIVY